MSNTFQTPETIAEVAAKLVGAEISIAALLHRDFEASYNGQRGSTVRVRVPGATEASTKPIHDSTTPLVASSIAEQEIEVKLENHVYSNVLLSEGALDLDLTSYAVQVLQPQASAIAKSVERSAVAALQATPADATIVYDPADPARAFTAMRRQLRQNGVTADEPLLAVVGADVYADLLDANDDLGEDESARVRGFRVVESTRLAPGEAIGFVRPAFALVVRAPAVPTGAAYGASVETDGFALRALRHYDGNVAADRSLVSAFVAVQAMPLAVDRETGVVDLVAHGGAVRLVTGA